MLTVNKQKCLILDLTEMYSRLLPPHKLGVNESLIVIIIIML